MTARPRSGRAARRSRAEEESLDALPDPVALDLLCLDLDDTILDNRSSMAEAWRAVGALLALRAGLDAQAVLGQLARSTRWFWGDAARTRRGRLDLDWARREVVAHVLEALDRPDPALAAEGGRLYGRERERGLRLHEGAHEVLARLRRRVPRLALVTNGAAAVQRAKLERFELGAFFDHVQLEGEFGAGKPDPSVYANVLRVFRVAPERCLMAGDDYEADVLGSLAAGMHAAWIDAHGAGRPPAPAPRPHATVRSLAELALRLRA
jgi:putative hydrolase of the HAD superfamily